MSLSLPRCLSILLALSALSALSASGSVVTIGDADPVLDNGVADAWDAIFVFNTPLVEPDASQTIGQVLEFEFWADTGTGGRTITPLLFSSLDGGATHQTIGVGTTYTIGEDGTTAGAANTLAFGLVDGTDTVDLATAGTTYYVGFHTTNRNGNAASAGGVVPFAGTGGGPNIIWQTESIPAVGQAPSTGASAVYQSNRAYAYNFDIDFRSNVPDPDSDGDGLPDSIEQQIIDADPNDGLASFAEVLPGDDFDGDGSSNLHEVERRTDPTDDDSDDDGLFDGHETGTGTFQGPTDTGTDPTKPDTDDDGLPDGVETNSGVFASGTDTGTNPNIRDTDNDGLLDGVENNTGTFESADRTGTDPHNPDSDDDLTLDGDEVAAGSDPNDPDSGATDGLIAGQQMVATDQDVADGWAVIYIDEERPFKLRGGTSSAIEFNFFASTASIGGGGRVTPFVVEPLGPNDFIVRAIGTTRIEGEDWTASGLQSFPFSDNETPLVQDGWMAGFLTADADGANPANQIIPYIVSDIEGWESGTAGPGDPGGVEIGSPPEPGTSGTSTEAFGRRDYSFQVVAGKPDRIDLLEVLHNPSTDTTELTWTSESGELFEVRKSPDLTGDPTTWPIVMAAVPASAAPATTTTAIVDSAASESAAFYTVIKIPPPPLYSEDFESGAPGWTTLDNGVSGATRWELGMPTNVGPFEAHSPSNCFGTDLDADYADGLNNNGKGIALRSPLIFLNGAQEATLSFWHVLDVINLDEGYVNFLDASGSLLETSSESPFFLLAFNWERVTIPIPQSVIANGEFIVEWEFRSETDATQNFSGWYIDDVLVEP